MVERKPEVLRRMAVLLVWLAAGIPATAAAEAVKLRNGQTIQGQIIRYDDRGVEVRIGAGQSLVRLYTADEVESIDVELTKEQAAANEAFSRGNYREAARQYIAAFRAENRNWVKSWIRVELLEALRGAGETAKAGVLFLEIAADRQDRDAVPIAPLKWSERAKIEPAATEQAKEWLESSRPLVRLLAASWLYDSADHDRCAEILERLRTENDPEIGQMAALQLHRPRRQTPKPAADEVAEKVSALQIKLRPGPELLLGNLYQIEERPEESALTYLRVFWNDFAPVDLALEALYLAAIESSKAGYTDDARRLFEMIQERYPETTYAKSAAERLANGGGAAK